MRGRLTGVLAQRKVIRLLVARDLQVRYEQTRLGYVWALLEPLLLALVYWFVFSKIARLNVPDYPLFVITGIMPWLWFSGVISESTRALTKEAKLVRTTALPREVWAVRVVGSKLADFVIAFPIVVLMAVIFQHGASRYLAALLLAVVLQAVMCTGIALLLSSLNVIFGDVARLVRVITRLFFYTTPIVYDVQVLRERFGDGWTGLYQINPLVGILELHHAVWFPDRFVGWDAVYISCVAAVLILVIGWVTFARLEPLVLKEL